MKTEKMNSEGLTFKEWVCAAGVAVFRDGMVAQYSTSDSQHISSDPLAGTFATEGRLKQLSNSQCRRYWHRGYQVFVVNRTIVFYPKKIRKAWISGEDPTDWKASISGTQ